MSDKEGSEKSVYYEALAISDEERRQAYLDVVCGDDFEIRRRVESLLNADHEAGSFLLASPVDSALEDRESKQSSGPGELEGMSIGPYRLLEKIGEGGFGVVYMADQTRPLRRRVALKVIKPGMDTEQVIARFDAERQALALMDHPNIATVFDAGATENGRPFFVMELVKGAPITEYCDNRNFSTAQRLELFATVCAAIQHAHQKGIIHRDIKPNNILVTTNGDQPVVKVIDFGVAKAAHGQLTDKTLFTHFRQFLGTPAYMSPEQAQMSAVDVDTRTDVYSLGVLLYELLTGKTPLDAHELRKAGFEELCRRIREDEAPMPSLRLSSLSHEEISFIAKTRCVDASRLPSEIRGDLDWIVVKAVEKDRSRRYPTAESFMQDVQRHLDGDPVSAVPPNSLYLLKKFAQRHRRLLASLASIGGMLLIASVVSTWLVVRLKREVAAKNIAITTAVEAQEEADRQRIQTQQVRYVSEMNNASMANRHYQLGLARSYLKRYANPDGDFDPRGWEWRALKQECEGHVASQFNTDGDTVRSICLIPNRPLLVTSSDRGSVRLWNHETGELFRTLSEHKSGPRIRFVKLGKKHDRIYGVSMDGVLHTWSLPTLLAKQQRLDVVGLHAVNAFDISPDESLLAVTDVGRSTIWKLPTIGKPELIKALDVNSSEFTAKFSPDGRSLLLGTNRRIRVVDVETWEDIAELPRGGNFGMDFSPDGSLLACSPRFITRHVDLYMTKDWRHMGQLNGHTGIIWDVEFSPDGSQLASASGDHTIRVWDVESLATQTVLLGHRAEVWAVKFTESGSRLFGGAKGEICSFKPIGIRNGWPVTKSIIPGGWHRRYSQASYSHNMKWLATCNQEDASAVTVSLRSPHTLEEIRSVPQLGDNVRGVRFSPVASLLVVGDRDGSLSVLNVDSPDAAPDAAQQHRLAETGEVCPVAFCDDGMKVLIVIQQENLAQYVIWSLPDSRALCSWTVDGVDRCADISPDGATAATGHEDGIVRFWNTNDGKEVGRVVLDAIIFSLRYSPDGKRLAVATGEPLLLLDTATYEKVGRFAPTTSTAHHSIAFSPDGSRIATGGGESANALKIWDVVTQRELITLGAEGDCYSSRQVEFSPDGDSVLLIGGGGFLKVWSLR